MDRKIGRTTEEMLAAGLVTQKLVDRIRMINVVRPEAEQQRRLDAWFSFETDRRKAAYEASRKMAKRRIEDDPYVRDLHARGVEYKLKHPRMTDQVIADRLGISLSTWKRWCKRLG